MVYHELAIDEDKWWEKEFEKVAYKISLKPVAANTGIDNDAPVKGGPASSSAAPVIQPTPIIAPTQVAPPAPPLQLAAKAASDWKTHNNVGTELCGSFQHGKCAKAVNGRCPHNSALAHQCAKCLDNRHGAMKCTADVKETKTKTNRRGTKRKAGGKA